MNRLVFLFLILLISACSSEETVRTLEHPSPDQELVSNKAELSLSLAESVFAEPPSSIETTITNNSQQNYEYGNYYYFEVNKDGDWYTLVHSDAVFLKNPQLNDLGQTLQAGSELQQAFSIDMLEVTLYPGDYRLVKTFLSQGEPYQEVSLAFPFTVE